MALSPQVEAALARARALVAAKKAEQQDATAGMPAAQLAELAAELPALPDALPATQSEEQDLVIAAHKGITLNTLQQEAMDTALRFENVAICGSAGTGKSTIMLATVAAMMRHPAMPVLHESTGRPDKPVLSKGDKGIIACSFTNTAVNNIARILDGICPCVTIHKLLEFSPVVYEVLDADSGEMKTTRRFEPARHRGNPLPAELRTIIIEESGVVSITLFQMLLEALPNPLAVQFIFLGDLFQLSPPYDPAILGYGLISDRIKKVELTQVYRQKLHSPILRLALDIKDRKPIPSNHLLDYNISNEHGTVVIKPWKHKLDEFKATMEAAKFMKREYEAGHYNPILDCIILPFNKRFGTTEMNVLIADFLGKARGAVVWEVISGYEKKYLAVGDSVMVAKQKGIITKIVKNGNYLGNTQPQPAAATLDRFGYNGNRAAMEDAAFLAESEVEDGSEIDRLLAASLSGNEDRLRSTSHIVTVKLDEGYEVELSNSGEFALSKFDFSYCLTCYKAQGSEWDTVYSFTHKSHAVMLNNEHFYTAATRAKKKLVMVVEPSHLSKEAMKQGIVGDNWQQKSAYFRRDIAKLNAVPFVKQFILGDKQS